MADVRLYYGKMILTVTQSIIDHGKLIQGFHIYKIFRQNLDSSSFLAIERSYISMLFDHKWARR